jgi:hypothetical protein
VATAPALVLEMVEIEADVSSASGYGAAVTVAGEYLLDLDVPAAAVLPRTLAVRALLDGDLVGRGAGFGAIATATIAVCPAEHGLEQLVIGEPLPVLLGGQHVHPAPEVIGLRGDFDGEGPAMAVCGVYPIARSRYSSIEP